ncbi:MAG: signal peptidase I [Rhodospirillales bacterium RIFCSPLOWO2_12_FULL_58_28]|nr:MAG: signal peptidase I [Rhodospirillales bacterium RIFCSPLOWO2_02_FULL_58_16]OHC79000.1 MAG: signal peptidase I [Rhodospirillales bacterium RIFCSPLOWO2_12_FULL_58_28]
MSNNNQNGFREGINTILYAVVIALVVRTFAYEPFNIPSGSMLPTLLVGDYLFVSKLSYGYSRHSLPLSLPLISGRIFAAEPERGDVAVFKLPIDNKTDYVKRIVGLPGDKIQVVDGILNINGKAVSRKQAPDYLTKDSFDVSTRFTSFIETLPNGREHYILEESDREYIDNTHVYTVPEGHYFGMGDNRDHSKDSRFADVGFIPRENLVGRADFLFFSINGQVLKFWEWGKSLRFNRFFTSIE